MAKAILCHEPSFRDVLMARVHGFRGVVLSRAEVSGKGLVARVQANASHQVLVPGVGGKESMAWAGGKVA